MSATASIRVHCRRDGFADTLRQLAWAVGHHVTYEPCAPDDPDRVALVLTDLDYASDEHVLSELGLDIVGKIDGVVSWEVVPRHPDAPAARARARSARRMGKSGEELGADRS